MAAQLIAPAAVAHLQPRLLARPLSLSRSAPSALTALKTNRGSAIVSSRCSSDSVRCSAFALGVSYPTPGVPEEYEPVEDPQEAARRAQASRRVESTAKYFRRLGVIGFWVQLACSLVASVILTFSIVITGKPTAPVSTYLTSAGIVAAFLSVFWSFGYLRLSDRLKAAISNPMKAPPRSSVVANLKSGLIINLLGLGSTLLGLQATVGVLVAKALTSSSPIYGAVGMPSGYNPVLALDVFLVQASGNTALAHFVGLLLTLELLRATTLSQPPPDSVLPKKA